MKVTDELMEKLATLARLEFSDSEKVGLKEDLNKITNFFDKLQEVDTSNVEPLIFISDDINALREDEINNEVSQKEALKNAPKKDSDYIKVPKVISNN